MSSEPIQEKNEMPMTQRLTDPFSAESKRRRFWSNDHMTGMPHFNQSHPIISLLTLALIFSPGYAEIIVSPKDVEVVQGSSVIFNCSSSLSNRYVQWNMCPLGNNMEAIPIYAFGNINPEYADRFTVQNGHNLHISSVSALDAGTYECQDDEGHGEKRSAELTVVVTIPICQTNTNLSKVVGNNTWGIEPSQVTLSCYVRFQGKRAPTLEWNKNDEKNAIASGVINEIRGDLVLHNLTLNGDSIADGSSYSCRLARATSTAQSCNSGKISIIGESCATCQCELPEICIIAVICSCVAIVMWVISFVVFHRFIKVRNAAKCGKPTEDHTNLLREEMEKQIKELKKRNEILEANNTELISQTTSNTSLSSSEEEQKVKKIQKSAVAGPKPG